MLVSAHRIICENMCWSPTSRGTMLVSTHRIVCENMWCVYVTLCSNEFCMCFRITLRFDYICIKWFIICLENYIWYHCVSLWNQNTCALLDSIQLCIVCNCLLDVWLTQSITIFRLKFSWEKKLWIYS